MAWISPRTVIKYFSGEDGAISELCFDRSDDDLGMEDEDPYDPMDPLDELESDSEGTQNSKKYLFNKWMQLLQIHRVFATERHLLVDDSTCRYIC